MVLMVLAASNNAHVVLGGVAIVRQEYVQVVKLDIVECTVKKVVHKDFGGEIVHKNVNVLKMENVTVLMDHVNAIVVIMESFVNKVSI